jgi:redox-sensitive bicupin YhaK (pirin superfamily)
MAPRYQRIGAEDIPTVRADGFQVRVIAGEFDARPGPASTLMPTLLWHVSVEAGKTFEAAIPAGYEVAAYVIEGEGTFDGAARAATGQLIVFGGTKGAVRFENPGAAKLEVMILGGAPAEGPLVFHGPFVMNSLDQVRAAEIAYRTGRMGELADD